MSNRRAHLAVMRAAAFDRGLRLSADEVLQLAWDSAVSTVADNSLTEAEGRAIGGTASADDPFAGYRKIKP